MKWREPGQEVDQRKLGERLWKKTVEHVDWIRRMPWIVVDGESRLGWLMTTMSLSGWMFLLVPAYPGCPGQIPQSHKTVVCVCVMFNHLHACHCGFIWKVLVCPKGCTDLPQVKQENQLANQSNQKMVTKMAGIYLCMYGQGRFQWSREYEHVTKSWYQTKHLMQLWRLEFELDGINSGSWFRCLPIRIYHWQWEEDCTAVVCEAVCCMEVRPDL